MAMTPCRLCTQGPTEARYTIGGYTILTCARCDGAFVEPLPDAAALWSYYDREYYEGGTKVSYGSYALGEPAARKEFRRLLQRLAPRTAEGWIVDIGCAYGYLLSELGDRRSVGVEVSFEAARQARKRGVRVVVATSDRLPIASGIASELFMLDTIEHVPNPLETLREARRVARRGARLILTTGDRGSLLARISGKRWRLLTPPSHLSFFTAAAVEESFARTRFRIEAIEHPWKRVSVGLAVHQLCTVLGLRRIRVPAFLHRMTVPVNLWDAFRVIAVAD